MARTAAQKGLDGITVTDHCDVILWRDVDITKSILSSVKEAKEADNKYGVRVFCGLEIGETFWQPDEAKRAITAADYDQVTGSVHAIDKDGMNVSYSTIDFSKYTEEELHTFMTVYFENMVTMLETTDIDVMAHLSCPIRYINGKFERGMDLARYEQRITDILKIIIEKNKALEVNTSGIGTSLGDTMPPKWVVKKYRELGGELVTIGSDAHVAQNAGNWFDGAIQMLKSLGFDAYYYYEKRKPQRCDIL